MPLSDPCPLRLGLTSDAVLGNLYRNIFTINNHNVLLHLDRETTLRLEAEEGGWIFLGDVHLYKYKVYR